MATIEMEGDIAGADWQKYVDELLSVHFHAKDVEYQRVPAAQGDCGLEGYTHTGFGFQSYSDKDTKTHAERTRKQKKKITSDLNKLVKYAPFWTTVFNPTKLRRWFLLVPHFDDKALLPHSVKRVDVLKSHNLSYIDSDFKVVIHTQADYPTARCLIEDPTIACRTVKGQPVTDSQVQGLISTQPKFIANIDRKLPRAMPGATTAELLEARKDFLNKHLWCSNYLDDLWNKFPTLWEKLDEFATATAESIQTEGHFDNTPAAERLANVRREFQEELKTVATFTTLGQQKKISWGHIAKWLGDCNLSFREVTNGT